MYTRYGGLYFTFTVCNVSSVFCPVCYRSRYHLLIFRMYLFVVPPYYFIKSFNFNCLHGRGHASIFNL